MDGIVRLGWMGQQDSNPTDTMDTTTDTKNTTTDTDFTNTTTDTMNTTNNTTHWHTTTTTLLLPALLTPTATATM